MIPNQWYAVLESNEVKNGKPYAFRRLGHDLVFWRKATGQLIVQADRCPHRQARLSLGKIADDCIECPFHGFRYDQAGTCQLIPANGKSGARPKIFQVKTWEVREAFGFIWLWNGAVSADYPALPFFSDQGLEHFAFGTYRRHWKTHYSRAIENQLDVAHIPFIHPDSIGRGGRTLVEGPFTLLENNSIYVWPNNQIDRGWAAARPNELTKPAKPWGLCFKFPNLWMLQPAEKLKLVAVFAPIDDENTMMYVRFYHNFVKNPWLRNLIGKVGAITGTRRILGQDERVVTSQLPKQGGFQSGDNYIPADYPILLYYKQREKLMEQATQTDQLLLSESPV